MGDIKSGFVNYDDEEENENNRRLTTFVNTQALDEDEFEDSDIRVTGGGMLNRKQSNDEDF